MISNWAWLSIIFFGSLLLCIEAGYRYGKRRHAKLNHESSKSPNILAGSVYGLLTLLLSFSFSLAVQRFETRRQLTVTEANSIERSLMRTEMLPRAIQGPVRKELAVYTDARLAFNLALSRGESEAIAFRDTQNSRRRIWRILDDSGYLESQSGSVYLCTTALSDMFDVAAARSAAAETHVPELIFALLVSISLGSALMAGIDLSARPSRALVHQIIFAGVLSFVMYVVADLDDPRRGFIRINQSDHLLQEIRDEMN